MESTRPIRALTRGLDALSALNQCNGATVAEVAQQIKLPRTTTYRILETLHRAGYIYRDSTDDHYRLSPRVRSLAAGFTDEAWVTEIARPHIRSLCDEIVWPVALSSPFGMEMLVRESTDDRSPLAVERIAPGFKLPLLSSASGRAYLAFCPPAQRESMLDILSRSNCEAGALARNRTELERILDETRAQGYATAVWSRKVSEHIAVALPLRAEERVLGAISVRFSGSAVPMKTALERFVPKLQDTVGKIHDAFAARHA